MAVGKYSPTVSAAYRHDQSWHIHHGGQAESNWSTPYDGRDYDNDSYDSYGYNSANIDRAGIHEDDYMLGEWIDDSFEYPLYESIWHEWGIDKNGLPIKR